MPTSDFFARLGLFVASGFCNAPLCTRLRTELRASRSEPATIIGSDGQVTVDSTIRSVRNLKVSPETVSLINSRLEALRPALEDHFHVTLQGWEKLSFLKYVQGDYYGGHRDENSNPKAPGYVQARRVSIVLFLNGEDAGPDDPGYGGGNLIFYGLLADSRGATYGFPLRGEEGLLVAFRSDILHEVTPITHGERFTLVTWFF